jgi:hypothetical protein
MLRFSSWKPPDRQDPGPTVGHDRQSGDLQRRVPTRCLPVQSRSCMMLLEDMTEHDTYELRTPNDTHIFDYI